MLGLPIQGQFIARTGAGYIPDTPTLALAALSATSFRATIGNVTGAMAVALKYKQLGATSWQTATRTGAGTIDVTSLVPSSMQVALAFVSDGFEISEPSQLAMVALTGTTPHVSFLTVDPYTQVLNRLWDILEAQSAFTSIVKAGNRIKFTSQDGLNPIKETIAAGDVPEVVIEPTTSQTQFAFTSQDVKEDAAWSLKMATVDLRLNYGLVLPLRWVVFKTLYAAGDTLGLDFVDKTRVTASMRNTYDPIESRGSKGWTELMTITTRLVFPKTGTVIYD